jgi:hypothetical protein
MNTELYKKTVFIFLFVFLLLFLLFGMEDSTGISSKDDELSVQSDSISQVEIVGSSSSSNAESQSALANESVASDKNDDQTHRRKNAQTVTGLVSDEGWKEWTAHAPGKEWKDAFYTFCKDTEKAKVDQEQIEQEVSWKDVTWDEQRKQAAQTVLEQEVERLSKTDYDKFEVEAQKNWNIFYSQHQNRFFKPRKYLHIEYPELVLYGIPPSVAQEMTTKRKRPEKEIRVVGEEASDAEIGSSSSSSNEISSDVVGSASCSRSSSSSNIMKNDGSRRVIMEAGCGTGSTLFPLMKLNHESATLAGAPFPYFYAFDFAKEAVECVKVITLFRPLFFL